MLFIVSAPSGAGKTTLVLAALEQLQKNHEIERVVTYTTRQPRPGDQHGFDYHFISQDQFLAKIKNGDFIEWSTAYGHYYGTPSSIIHNIARGRSYIVIIDRQGARSILQHIKDAVTIWLVVPSIEELRMRIIKRGANNSEQIERRLLLAQQEITEEAAQRMYEYHIMNDDFSVALTKMTILMNERLQGYNTMSMERKKDISCF